MHIFIAGATGVLGRRVVPLLVADGHAVTAVARTPQKAAELREQGASPATVDLFDRAAVTAAVAGHDAVVNLATAIPPTMRMLRPSAWRMTARLRSEAARNLVDAAIAAGATRYLQEALAFMYEDHGAEWITEDAPLHPTRVAATVTTAEAHTRRFDASADTGVVLRFGLLYGADSVHTRDTLDLARRGILALPAHAGDYQPMVHLDDAAAAVTATLDAPGGAYNVVEDHPLTSSEHARVLGELLGRRIIPVPAWLGVGPLGGFARSQRVSNRRLRSTTRWRARFASRRDGWAAVLAGLEGGHTRASAS